MTETLTAAELIIGIDPGVNTGYAIWMTNQKHLAQVISLPIHEVMQDLLIKRNTIKLVRFEDARLRKYFTGGKEKAQGAGSIKRDSKIWEDYLTWLGVPFEMGAPKDSRTKLDAITFKKLTGYPHKTNEHGRDAAMLVFGIKN